MINLINTPQRADFKAEYAIENDILTITIGESTEVFDFTDFDEGVAEEIIAEELPVNPIISAKKVGNIVNIKVIRFYDKDEKRLFENGGY